VGFDDPEDFGNLTPRDRRNIKRNAQATSFPTRKKELAIIVETPSTSLRIALMRKEKTRMIRARGVTREIKNHITRE
jgi:hypothetical protein